MTLAAIEAAANPYQLTVLGACQTEPEDGLGMGTVILLGPLEPGFWRYVTAEPEFADGGDDPLDRWSTRAIKTVAECCNGTALFSFGTPARPFISWALRSGRAWTSPVGLLVHDTAGLMVSYRGAVLLPDRFKLTEPDVSPCISCKDQPCLTACPVNALTSDGYDLAACHSFLDSTTGTACMKKGCAVRRSCPVSQTYGRSHAQSEYHMHQFHRS